MNGARREVFDLDGDRALEALRLACGDAYGIGVHRGVWTALSRADERRTLTGDTPDALNAAIRAESAREGTL